MACNNQIKTNQRWYPNTSIEFATNGIWLRVSINIEPALAVYLPEQYVVKGKFRTVYALRSFLESAYICKDTMESIHHILLSNCMKNVRIAKDKQNGFKTT
jgi:hypothetical protein